MMDSLLGQRYEVRQEIGRGGYGQVCKGYDHERGRKVAIKLERADELDGEVSYLKKEKEVYSKLKGEESFGIANIHQFGADLIHDDPNDGLDDNGYILHYMVMDLLGPDLEKLLTKCSEQFSLKTVLLLADQMIRIIQYVHSKDYIHGDIKPTNFVLGRGKKGSNMIYMVDFGLAQRYRDSQTKEHITYSDTASYAGTTKFSSLNCHQCIQQSRRDDLESLGYVLLYFLCGSLPWQAIKDWNDKSEKRRLVYEKKASISLEELCTGLPCEFVKYMEYCRSLQFDHEPDYDYLRELFQDLYDQAGFTDALEYDWTLRSQQGTYYGPGKYYINDHYDSSKVKPEDVFFFFQSLYKPMPEPYLCLESTEQCLEQLLKFVSVPGSFNSERKFEWKGESMEEIKNYYIESFEEIAWIHKWDNLDWKTASDLEKDEKKALFDKLLPNQNDNSLLENICVDFMSAAYDVYTDYLEYKEKKETEKVQEEIEKLTLTGSKRKKIPKRVKSWVSGFKSEKVKAFIEKLAAISSAQSYMRNGLCTHTLPVVLQKEDISDSLVENRSISVAVKPDGVFTNPVASTTFTKASLWSLVVEVYGPFKLEVLNHQDDDADLSTDPSTSAPSISDHSKSAGNEDLDAERQSGDNLAHQAPKTINQSTSGESLSKPKIKKNIIQSYTFRKEVRNYIEKSVPNSCLDKHTIHKMTGQHILQLFSQVNQNFDLWKQISAEVSLWDGIHGYEIKGKSFQKAIGMYVVNEYIYFSRLDIAPFTLDVLTTNIHKLESEKNRMIYKQHPPLITFSNFRFDITKKSDRLALIIFIKLYLFKNSSRDRDLHGKK